MTAHAPTPRRRRSTIIIVVVALVVALVAVAVGGEFYARHRVGQCVSTALQDELGGDVDVSLGATPLLATVFTGTVSSLTLSSDDATLAGPGSTAMRHLHLHSTIHDISLPEGDDAGSVGSSQATVRWGADGMLASLQTLPFGNLITGVSADESAGTLRVEIVGGLGAITLTPRITGGWVGIDATDVSALGIGLPTGGAQQIIDQLTGELSEYPLQMRPRKVAVTDDGLRVELSGGNAPLGSEGTRIDCSII